MPGRGCDNTLLPGSLSTPNKLAHLAGAQLVPKMQTQHSTHLSRNSLIRNCTLSLSPNGKSSKLQTQTKTVPA